MQNIILEFGESNLFYVSSGAKIERNLLVGNALTGETRPYYSFHANSQADNLNDNTILYDGCTGGHLSWSHSNQAHRNLWVGLSFLSKWHDNAVFHAFVGSQTDLVIQDNWVRGAHAFSRHNTRISHLLTLSPFLSLIILTVSWPIEGQIHPIGYRKINDNAGHAHHHERKRFSRTRASDGQGRRAHL